MKAIMKRLIFDQRGATAIEYGLIVALIVIAMIVALDGLANENNRIWNEFTKKSADAVEKANGG